MSDYDAWLLGLLLFAATAGAVACCWVFKQLRDVVERCNRFTYELRHDRINRQIAESWMVKRSERCTGNWRETQKWVAAVIADSYRKNHPPVLDLGNGQPAAAKA